MKMFRLFVAFSLICFVLSPRAQAVSPPPDGGYPNKNTAEGDQALLSLTTGFDNTAIGYQALQNNTKGDHNTASGFVALRHNTTGSDNTASGAFALSANTTGLFNTANGTQALTSNTTGWENTATGEGALKYNTTGPGNTANGQEALVANTSGERNTAIGWHSLEKNTTGSFNVALGAGAGNRVTTADDVICIGRGVDGVNVGGTCFIGNIRGVTTQNANALPVVIDGAGQLGTIASSERFKKDIAIMDKASEGILSLRPVTFHYKTDDENTPQFGLIAEEVAKVNPALVLPDKEGKPYTVRYDAVNAMLLNEFLKEHKAFLEEHRTVEELKKQVAALTAAVQKVSAQLATASPSLADLKSAKPHRKRF
jgi:hypothetical protein